MDQNENDNSNISAFSIIPTCILLNDEIEQGAKLLFGHISSLAHLRGYCFASNERFAELHHVDERTIKRWLKSLRDLQSIRIEIIKFQDENGFIKSKRKIWITLDFQKMFTKGQKCHLGDEEVRGDKNVPYNKISNINNINYKENITKESPTTAGASAPLASKEAHECSSFSKESKELIDYLSSKYNEYRKSLKLKECEKKIIPKKWLVESTKMLKDNSLEKIKETIDWIFKNEFWKNVIESPLSLSKNLKKLEILQANDKKGISTPTENQEYAKMIVSKLQKFKGSGRNNFQVDALTTYFEMSFPSSQAQPICLYYDSQDFKEKLDELLKQKGLKI